MGENATHRFASFEAQLVSWLRKEFPPTAVNPLGLDDDAAALYMGRDSSQPRLAPPEGPLVVTTDLLAEGVHFDSAAPVSSLSAIGYKALAVNLSDLAAMAARPEAFFVSLAVPRSWTLEQAQELYRGMTPLVREFQLTLGGGDTNRWSAGLCLSVTAIGTTGTNGPLTRNGARVGDRVLVTGPLGGSILGKHLRFPPRVQAALYLRERYSLHAAVDISDGLALDAARVASASGVGIELWADQIPIAEDAQRLAHRTGKRPLDHALSDGEDFELLLFAPQDQAEAIVRDPAVPSVEATVIGSVVRQCGLWLRETPRAAPIAWEPTGFEHA